MSRTMSKVLSVLLSLMMFVTITVLPNKVEASDLLGDDNIKVKDEYIETDEKEISVIDKTELITVESLNGMISIEDVEKYGHVAREVQNETSLNSMVMKNSDGTMTTYIFSEDIKYVDEFGNVKDKETSLGVVTDKAYTANYAYETINNDVQVLFPRSLGEDSGVLLGKDDISIELKPILSDHTVSRNVQLDNLSGSKTTFEPTKLQISVGDESYRLQDVVDYTNVFAANTTLRYTPTLNGFKEDIVISEPTGVNEFTFSLKTNGMKLVEENNSYYLVDPETSIKKVSMGSLVVYDGNGIISNNGYSHRYEITTVTENVEYIIKILVDREYLENESTAYPVTIDPSFEILPEENNIMDISVRANGIVYNDSVNNGVGHHNVLLEDMRTFIKFPGLLDDPAFENFAPPGYGYSDFREIQSIKLQMYSRGSSFVDTQVRVYSYDTSSSLNWTYNTTNFTSTQFNALGSLQSSTVVPYGFAQWVEFDITTASIYNGENGIVLVNQYEGTGNDPVYQSFASTKDANYKPRIVVTWTGDDNTTFDSALPIENDTVYDVLIPTSGSKKYYLFTPSSTRFYTFESTDRVNADPYVWIYNNSQVLLTSNDDGAGNRNFKATYHLELGKTYYIVVGCYGTTTGSYSLNISDSTNLAELNSTTVITTTTTGSANISSAQQKSYFKFTPSVSCYYTISSSNSTSDPYGWIYRETGQYITKNDDGSSGRDFTICVYLESGQTYYIVGGCYGTNTDTYTVNVAVTTPYAPSNLTVSNVTENSMNLSWNIPSTHYANRWLIQRRSNGGAWSNFATVTSDTTNYFVSGLTASSSYEFRIYGESGGPAWSGTRSLSSSNSVSVKTLPAKPTNLTVTNKTGNSVSFTWSTASPHGADRWRVEYVVGTQPWQEVTTVTSKSFTMNGLTASTVYAFRVIAECDNDDGTITDSEISDTLRITTLPAQPTNLTVTGKTGNSVSLTWNTASPHGAARWLVQYRTIGGTWSDYFVIWNTGYTVTGLTSSTEYEFRVYAESGSTVGEGTKSIVSNTATTKTLPAQPTNLTVSTLTSNSVSLTWDTETWNYIDRWLVQYRPSGGTWSAYFVTWNTGYTVTELDPNTTYEFRVYAESGTPAKAGTKSVVSNTATATTTVGSVQLTQLITEINDSEIIDHDKKAACVAAATALFDDYEPAFIVGLLANINCEGNTGILEIFNADEIDENGNKKYDPTVYDYLYNFDKYLKSLDNPTTYYAKYSGKRIWEINLTNFFDHMTLFNDLGWYATAAMQQKWGDTPGIYNRIGTGMGCVGWTFTRAYQLLNFYRIKCNYSDKIEESQALEAEVEMILYELNGEEHWVYTNWLSANESNLNSPSAAKNAGYYICYHYEQPYGYDTGVSDYRGNLAESLYNELMQ